ncbi:Gfo/Idh/MocA family protein [Oricola indica]|jgi:predicted dehydrogenase|uniref:Gfo/Idh/MocA family protein n=1 Tax=Oricola indica TaxID=2872591 RepID=UPI001CBC19CD|nr:Gfo/Idh/MocA family oxidoreductase [Oricola indica]
MSDLKLAVIGIDHRHIFGQLAGMLDLGCTCKGWWTEGEPQPVEGFVKRFPDIPRVADRRELLDDPDIDLVLIADIPARRAGRAIEAMRAGKDVMTDKPGCTTLEQLDEIRKVVAETGRIWSIDFSERFEVPAVGKAAELVREGLIGDVVQTVGLGPHRLNRPTRPDWFFECDQYGGVLCDIASHQIDQFLFFTGSDDAEIVASSVGNFANPGDPGLEDFGEILLRSDKGQGYIRVDWYTPDALPTWGDGRLTILGTKGTIELRKYVDIAGRPGTDHVFLVNGERYEHIDGSAAPLTYFRDLANDIRDRTETAMSQAHCFKVMELALKAQAQAARLGNLKGA